METPEDLHWLPGWRIRELITTGQVSPTEVVEHFLDRAEALDGPLACFITIASDSALATAGRLERKLRSGKELGALFGVPVAVKDQYPTRGVRTTAGSLTLVDHVPDVDAAFVERLKAADAVIIGKTNMPEFALFWRTRNYVTEETRNPWDPDRSAGGSSGGSAAAVAAGLVPVAIGSDGGGSTRLPAAFCGVVGLLPSVGVVPNHGAIGRAQLFDRIGPIARDLRDVATVLGVISGADPRDPLSCRRDIAFDPEMLRDGAIGGRYLPWIVPPELTGQESGVAEVVEGAIKLLPKLGAEVHDSVVEMDLGYVQAFHIISSSDRYGLHAKRLFDDGATRSLLTPYARTMYETGKSWSGAEYALALEERYRWIKKVEDLFAVHDFLISPTVAFTAPHLRDDWEWVPPGIGAYTRLGNFCGFAALSLPCGFVNQVPVGLQIMGPPGSEPRLLAVARALEVAGVLDVRHPHVP